MMSRIARMSQTWVCQPLQAKLAVDGNIACIVIVELYVLQPHSVFSTAVLSGSKGPKGPNHQRIMEMTVQ